MKFRKANTIIATILAISRLNIIGLGSWIVTVLYMRIRLKCQRKATAKPSIIPLVIHHLICFSPFFLSVLNIHPTIQHINSKSVKSLNDFWR